MAEEGVKDHLSAKRKAAERLGLTPTKSLPSNQEIEAALAEYLQLFHRDRLHETLSRLRRLALEAMRFMAKFDPYLVGPVLHGTVTSGSEIQLHVTAETAEEIGWYLTEHNIAYEETERRLRFGGERYENLPAFRFLADTSTIEICVFTKKTVRERPYSPVTGKPEQRGDLKEVSTLLSGLVRPD